MRRAWPIVLVWTLTVAVLIGLAVGWAQFRFWLERPVLSTGATSVTVIIRPGLDARQIGREIQASGARVNANIFYWTARVRGISHRLQAGEYQLQPGESLAQLQDRIKAGDVVLHQLTVPEGVTAQEFLKRLAEDDAVDHTLSGMDEQQIIEAVGLPVQHLAGWLFPDTYTFTRGTSDRKILRQAYHAMKQRLDAAWADRSTDLPLKTPYDALILASIVEKETGVPAERARVASVFINRLRKGMRLQTDPTVIYGLGADYNGMLTESDLRRDTPYNTYTRKGLPPTPIALPSEASLQAVTHPLDTDDLYFVANGSGGHHFSKTLREHNAAVRAWRKLERSRDEKQGN